MGDPCGFSDVTWTWPASALASANWNAGRLRHRDVQHAVLGLAVPSAFFAPTAARRPVSSPGTRGGLGHVGRDVARVVALHEPAGMLVFCQS